MTVVSDTQTEAREVPVTELLPRLETMAENLRRLAGLLLDEEYDDDFLRPTRVAFEAAWEILVAAEEARLSGLPPASPAPVGDGGILIDWERGDRRVFLAIPADPSEGYIYLRGPEYRRTIRELSGEALSSSLDWLLAE